MSLRRRFAFLDDPFYGSPLHFTETSILAHKHLSFFEDSQDVTFAMDLLNIARHPLDFFDPFADLIQIEREKSLASYCRRLRSRIEAESYLETLIDRVSALELNQHRLRLGKHNCNYSCKTEIKEKHRGRKYKWTSEMKEAEKKKKNRHKEGKSSCYTWTVEIKEKGEEGPIKRTYTWTSLSGDGSKLVEDKKEKEKKKKGHSATRLVKIEEHGDHGDRLLRQAFARRPGAIKKAKGKNKELSHHDAAATIQRSFRAHLTRKSQSLGALRELAIAKAKLKEIRTLFNHFSYRRRIAMDTEERQRFTEKMIVVLLTVDAIEGIDSLVRAAKKSMVVELETMLDMVDPKPPGKSLHHTRRTFDVPNGFINKEISEGVGKIMTMLEQEEDNGNDI